MPGKVKEKAKAEKVFQGNVSFAVSPDIFRRIVIWRVLKKCEKRLAENVKESGIRRQNVYELKIFPRILF